MSLLLLRPADLDAYLGDLPVATVVLQRLQQLLLGEETDLASVVGLVYCEPALASQVMHAASCAYYGGGRRLDSLEEAVALLGLRETYRVTAAFAMSRFLNTALRIYGLPPAEYWRRSLACALLMEQQAPWRGLDAGVAYTAGLMHAIGMVVVDRHLRAVGDPGLMLRDLPACPVERQEQRLIGVNHAQLAGVVLRRWGFGDEVAVPAEWQNEPARARPPHEVMTALLGEARMEAWELVRTMPPPDRGAKIALGTDPESVVGRILELERWLR